MRMSRGDFSFLTVSRVSAILPISVFIPVSTTTATARPVITDAPAKSMFFLSARPVFSAIVSVCFSTSVLSPVSSDSSTFKFEHVKILMSAEILSPDSKKTISPTTKFLASTWVFSPSLSTLTLVFTILTSELAILCARFSCIVPIVRSMAINKNMTTASIHSPTSSEKNVANSRSRTMGLISSRPKIFQVEILFFCGSSFFPFACRRSSASADFRPSSEELTFFSASSLLIA